MIKVRVVPVVRVCRDVSANLLVMEFRLLRGASKAQGCDLPNQSGVL